MPLTKAAKRNLTAANAEDRVRRVVKAAVVIVREEIVPAANAVAPDRIVKVAVAPDRAFKAVVMPVAVNRANGAKHLLRCRILTSLSCPTKRASNPSRARSA